MSQGTQRAPRVSKACGTDPDCAKTPHCKAKPRAWRLQVLGTFPLSLPPFQPAQCRSRVQRVFRAGLRKP